MSPRPVSPALAFAVAALGVGLYSCMDAVMKGLALALGAYATMLWRTIAGTVISGGPWLATRPSWPAWPILRLHLVRGVVCAGMAVLFFWGLARVPMAQAVALAFVAPLIALLLAALFLKERIGREIVLASLLAFAGVLLILGGQAASHAGPEALRGALAVLASAVCYAVNIILMRAQAQRAGVLEITLFLNLVIAVTLALPLPFLPRLAVMPETGQLLPILLAAVLATVSASLMTWGYARAPASYLVATEYTGFLWAAALGWLVFREPVSLWTLAGAGLIVAGCAWTSIRGAVPATGPEAPL